VLFFFKKPATVIPRLCALRTRATKLPVICCSFLCLLIGLLVCVSPPFNVHFQLPCCLTIPLRPFSVCKMIIIIIKWVRERRTCVSRCWRCYRTRQHTLETGYFSRRTLWKSKRKGRDGLCTSSPLFFFLNSRHKCFVIFLSASCFSPKKEKLTGCLFYIVMRIFFRDTKMNAPATLVEDLVSLLGRYVEAIFTAVQCFLSTHLVFTAPPLLLHEFLPQHNLLSLVLCHPHCVFTGLTYANRHTRHCRSTSLLPPSVPHILSTQSLLHKQFTTCFFFFLLPCLI
jgi:hypothetical protein